MSLDIMGMSMRRREANERLMKDYDVAVGKYARPLLIYGMKFNRNFAVPTEGRVIVRVEETQLEDIIRWDGDKAIPIWKVSIARDPYGLTRALRMACIAGSAYHLGKTGSQGPFYAMSETIQLLSTVH